MRGRARGAELHSWGAGGGEFEEFEIFAIEARGDVAGLLRALEFIVEGIDHLALDRIAAGGVDGVGDVGVELEAAVAGVLVAEVAVLIEMMAAIIAELGAEVVFLVAAIAMVGQFPRGHREKRAIIAIDQLYVANDESVIEGQGAEGLEP